MLFSFGFEDAIFNCCVYVKVHDSLKMALFPKAPVMGLCPEERINVCAAYMQDSQNLCDVISHCV